MRWHLHFPETRLGIALAGLLDGVFSTSTGFSALPVIWLVRRLSEKQLRRTSLAYLAVVGVLAIVTSGV